MRKRLKMLSSQGSHSKVSLSCGLHCLTYFHESFSYCLARLHSTKFVHSAYTDKIQHLIFSAAEMMSFSMSDFL